MVVVVAEGCDGAPRPARRATAASTAMTIMAAATRRVFTFAPPSSLVLAAVVNVCSLRRAGDRLSGHPPSEVLGVLCSILTIE